MKPLLLLTATILLAAVSVQAQSTIDTHYFPVWQDSELSPIQKAILADDAAKVLELLKVSPPTQLGIKRSGKTALEVALEYNRPKVVRALLEAGADPNRGFPLGDVLRHSTEDWRSLAEILIEHGAVINSPSTSDYPNQHLISLLDVSSQTRQKWEFLLQHGADVLGSQLSPQAGKESHPLIEYAFEKNNPDSLAAILEFVPVATRFETYFNYNSSRGTTLHLATRFRNEAAVRQLIGRGANLEVRDSNGKMPLDYSLDKTDGLLKLLLEAGAKPQERTLNSALDQLDIWLYPKGGFVPEYIFTAPSKPSIALAEWLAPLVARLRFAPHSPKTLSPLLRALKTRDLDVLQLLSDAAPPTNDQERFFLAASKGDVSSLEALTRKKPVLVTGALPTGETPLHFAALWGEAKSVEFLCSHGANPSSGLKANPTKAQRNKRTPLHYALHLSSPARSLRTNSTVRTLLQHSADVNASNGTTTVLMEALLTQNEGAVTQILNKGANPDGELFQAKYTPLEVLVYGVSHEKYDRQIGVSLARLLLERGAQPNVTNLNERTPLSEAVSGDEGNFELSRLLMRFGADINLHVSSDERFSGVTPLNASLGYPTRIRFALEHGANPTIPAFDKSSLLESICGSYLLATSDQDSRRPLGEPSPLDWLTSARLLLETKKVSPRTSYRQSSPLQLAVRARTPEMLALLLEFGADPNEKDATGETPLDFARKYLKTEMVVLMEAALVRKPVVH